MMQESLNKLITNGIDVNILIPTSTWISLGLAIAISGMILIITTQTFKKL